MSKIIPPNKHVKSQFINESQKKKKDMSNRNKGRKIWMLNGLHPVGDVDESSLPLA